MEFIFEFVSELIIEPIIEGWVTAMTYVFGDSLKINEEKVKCIVVIECIVLLLMFIVGGIMWADTEGESFAGRTIFIASVVISVFLNFPWNYIREIKKKVIFTNIPLQFIKVVV